MCVCLEWEAHALHKAAAAGGPAQLGSGRPFPRWWENCGDVADPLGSCPCLQALEALPLSWHLPGPPKGSLCGEVAQLRSVKQAGTSAAWVARGHWVSVLSLASAAAGFLHRNVPSVT